MIFPGPAPSPRDVGIAELDGAMSPLSLRHNLLTDRPEILDAHTWIPVTDAIVTQARSWLAAAYSTARGRPYTPPIGDVEAVLHERARRTIYHPIREYLDGVGDWDGVDRIAWIAERLGCDDTLSIELLKRWLVSACARATWPGCKADHVLVLVGEQGARKSSLIHTLAAGRRTAHVPWSSDTHVGDVAEKDTAMRMQCAWIIEVQELDGLLSRRDAQAVKAFLTTAEDHYRAPYARTVEPHPRSSVCIGTSNTSEFLRDPTGNRRFWPLRVTRRLEEDDLLRVRDGRDQVWAQALVIFREERRWHLLPDEESLLAERHVTHAAANEDPWFDLLGPWLIQRASAGMRDVCDVLEIPRERQTRATVDRIAAVLRAHGWTRQHTRDGKRWAPARTLITH